MYKDDYTVPETPKRPLKENKNTDKEQLGND